MAANEPVAFSPREFSALFNKEQSWGYRQIYRGRVAAITEFGRILIPASEVEKILATAGRYNGKPKLGRTKKQFEEIKPELQIAWANFLSKRRGSPQVAGEEVLADARKAAIKRLTGRKGKSEEKNGRRSKRDALANSRLKRP